MSKPSLHGLVAFAGLAMAGLVATPVHAQLIITPIFDSSITSDPNAAAIESTINTAIQTYQSCFRQRI